MSEKFRLLDDEEGKQADMLKRNNYFMTSGDKVRFFFDPLAYDKDEKLVDGEISTDFPLKLSFTQNLSNA